MRGACSSVMTCSQAQHLDDPLRDSPTDLAFEQPEKALELMARAHDQAHAHSRAQAERQLKDRIMSPEDTTSVASSIETSEDRIAAATRELIETIRRATGEAVDREVPPFNPDLEVQLSREEQADPAVTVGEFRKSVLEPDERSVKHGLTDAEGNPLPDDPAWEASLSSFPG
jgi:hypothetical protein